MFLPLLYLTFWLFNARWFKSVDWEEVYYKQLKPPIIPKVCFKVTRWLFQKFEEKAKTVFWTLWTKCKYQLQFLLIQVPIWSLQLGAECIKVFTLCQVSTHIDNMNVQWSGAAAYFRCTIEPNTTRRSVMTATQGTLMTIPRPTGDRWSKITKIKD